MLPYVTDPDEITPLVVVTDTSDGTFVRLRCGVFTFLGFPPVSVVWKDPVGQLLASTGFTDHHFTLDLPVKVARSGLYGCHLDCQNPSHCCLDDQSTLRQWAQIEVQINNKDLETSKEDGVSLANFSSLVQRVEELEKTRAEDCRESSVAAMAHLVHRQAKCDQLDAFLDRLVAAEKKVEDLWNISTIINEIKDELDSTNHTLNEFQLQTLNEMTTVNQLFSDFRLQLEKETMDINETLKNVLLKHLQIEDRIPKVDERMSQVDERMLQVDVRISKWEDSRRTESNCCSQLSSNLTAIAKDVAVFKTETRSEMSTMRSKVTDITSALNTQVTTLNETHAALFSEISALTRISEQPPNGGCPVKEGYMLYRKRCLKLYTVRLDYETPRRRCEADGAHLFYFKSRELDGLALLSLMDTNGKSPTS